MLINDQTVNDETASARPAPGRRHGGPQANVEAFTETRWVTVRGDLPGYPF